jgi:ParB family chromosome partitioning protein
MNFKEQIVPINAIDTENKTFKITTCTQVANLVDSIKSFQLLNHPILIQKNDHCAVISGFRRIAACQYMGWSSIPARVLALDTDHLSCIKIAVAENATQRPLNLIEQSRAFNLLSACVNKDNNHLAEISSDLGLPGTPTLIKKIKQLALLNPFIQECVLDESVSLSIALEFAKMSPDVAIEFAEIFSQLKLSLNKQREIIVLVEEISIREEIGAVEVLQHGFLKETLENNDLDRNKKAQKIRYYLKRRRFPEITKTEKEFDDHVKDLKLASNIKLMPPKNFEGNVFTLSISFKNMIELSESRKGIDKIIQHPALNNILC